jgi:asparagine synthase (glutamine-hydrolysing)
MCGISGVISLHALNEDSRSRVGRMNGLLFHRGPDSDGRFDAEHVALAMRRLSIIDLAGGRQPLFNETGDIAIVCNGEIYNHHELRRTLQARGHRFATGSDVETIVHAYEEYGLDCLDHLRGMFAFALWDGPRRRLMLARDRMGEKPLYLHRDGRGQLWFSSEMRSLCAALPHAPDLTAEAFNLFLAFQYVPEPATPLAGIEVLPAGHYLLVEPGSGSVDASPCRYWDLGRTLADPSSPVDTVEHSLDEACRLMGTADVPVAIALSGGIDSSLVAALTARHYPDRLHAFTIGYRGRPDTDERSFAADLARQLKIGFTEVELDTADVVDGFPAMVAAMDTPVGDIAAFGYYAVSRAAREAGFPVLLSGMGGDEFFWGYQWVREAVGRNEAILAGTRRSGSWLRRLLGRGEAQQPDFFGIHPDLCNGDRWSRELLPAGRRAALPPGYWLQQNSLDVELPMHRAVSELLNRTWLRSNCLALVDRMSMAHSVEVRLPLLDVELVNKVSGMRNAGLQDWTRPHKWLLIEALRDALPAEVLSRKKQGFTPPVRQWMQAVVARHGGLLARGALVRQGLLEEARSCGEFSGFDPTFMYKLVLLECWTRMHVEGMPADELAGLAAESR